MALSTDMPSRARILVFSNELPPLPGVSVGGGGLRVRGLVQGLRAIGHEVILSLAEPLLERVPAPPPSLMDWRHTGASAAAIVQRALPDVVIFEQWGLLGALPRLPLPVVVDIPGPLILENLYRGHGALEPNVLAKCRALEKADWVLCSSASQARYHVPWLLMAGFSPEGALPIRAMAPGLPPDPPPHEFPDEPRLLFAGLLWPWQDPFTTLRVAAGELERRGAGRLELITGAHVDNLGVDAKGRYTKVTPTGAREEFLTRAPKSPRVSVTGLLPFDEFTERARTATLFLDLMAPNLERDLAFPTRTVHALWCGLPVLHSAQSELAALIARYDAGWLCDPGDEAAISAALAEALDDPKRLDAKSEGARRLARDHFAWDRAIAPLADIITQPTRRSAGSSPLLRLSDLDRFDRTLGRFDDQFARLDDAFDRLAAQEGRRARLLEEELAAMRAEADQLRAQLADQRAQVAEVQGELDELEKLVEGLESRMSGSGGAS